MTDKKAKPPKAELKTIDKISGPPQIFDVSKPGSLPPAHATSRPVIVTNRSVMQDPMMIQPGAEDNPNDLRPKQRTIQPIKTDNTDSADPAKLTIQFDSDTDGMVDADKPAATPADATKQSETPAESAPAAEATPAAEPKPAIESKKEAPAETPAAAKDTNSSPSTDQSEDDAASLQTKAAREEAELAASAKAQDELDTMVDQKTYFLPINATEQRRSRYVFIYGGILILLLGLIWLDIALDAGLIQVDGLQSFTHFFHN